LIHVITAKKEEGEVEGTRIRCSEIKRTMQQGEEDGRKIHVLLCALSSLRMAVSRDVATSDTLTR